ncbi:hypothetical protein [Streptomyces sp. NPDC047079]|uniref:hypothetical protein n=1 Tax=Streptomyces sp. NPDC047079 TaxID=3154607 RepID=UPI003409DCE3
MRFDQSLADKLDATILERALPEDAAQTLGLWLADPKGTAVRDVRGTTGKLRAIEPTVDQPRPFSPR